MKNIIFADNGKYLEIESQYRQQHLDALTFKAVAKAPVSLRPIMFEDDNDFSIPSYTYNEQYFDKTKMFEKQLATAMVL